MSKKGIDWQCLKRLYEFESSRVSGPATCRRDINDVLWSVNDLQTSLSLSSEELKKYTNIIEFLFKKNQILKIPMEDETRYITRMAEIVRLLGHNYEYWFRGRQSIDSIRWLVEEKTIPSRDIPAEEFMKRLLDSVNSKIADEKSKINLRNAIKMVMIGMAKCLEPEDWKSARFSEFQYRATEEMILSQFKPNHEFKAQILTAGVGSGKTIGFSIGMLVSAVDGILGGETTRKCHLFLYPRKALARDQYTKLKEVIKNIGHPELYVHFEHHSYYDSEHLSVKRGIPKIYGGNNPPPSIIVTTLETLNRRLQHPLVVQKLSKYLKRVVLDEIHLIEGIPGCHIVRLIDRLKQSSYNPKKILWTGSSATVARPDEHCSTVFGIDEEKIKIIDPLANELETVGLVSHVFMRPNGKLSFLGSLVNSTSILVHNRRDGVWNRKKRGTHKKAIGFADSLDLLGRWNSDFRENERTENVNSRRHPTTRKIEDWQSRQREIPYALRYQKPLQKRIEVIGGQKEPYEEVLSEFKGKEICDRCKNGERFVLKTCNKDEMYKLGRLVYRWPHENKDNVKTFSLENEVFNQDSVKVGTLDLCPFLRAGACFWFSQDDLESEPIIEGDYPRYEWRSVVRSKIHTSKSKTEYGLEDNLGEIVFTSSSRTIYDVGSKDDHLVIDLVLASPSLEVGVDLPRVTESIMFKAIRNVASYRQKVGRIGREIGTDTVNVSLLSLRPVDLHYYRQPRKLISRAQLEPIPLKEYNKSILKCALYMAVWDFLAAFGDLPEVIPTDNVSNGETEFSRRLRYSRDYLVTNSQSVARFLSKISRDEHGPSAAIIQEAINQVVDEIDVFLTPIAGTIDDVRLTTIADMIVHALVPYGVKVRPPNVSRNLRLLRNGEKAYNQYRPQLNPIIFGLGDEFQKLDLLNDCGWADFEGLKTIYKTIENKLMNIGNESNPLIEDYIDILESLQYSALRKILRGLEGMAQSGENAIVKYFFEQFNSFLKQQKSKGYYLSYLMEGLPIFRLKRRDNSYVRIPNLFTNPYENTVTLYRKGEVLDNVPINEAMFGFIPGTWTYRMGKNAEKTLVGLLDASQGGVLSASIDEMRKQNSEFIRIKTDVPAPPGFPADQLTIYMPVKLGLSTVYGKYVRLNPNLRAIIDKDECFGFANDTEEDEEPDDSYDASSRPIKIPKCFANRWVHIESDKGERILVNSLDEEYLVVEGEPKSCGEKAREKIYHPLLKGMIDAVLWHDSLRVIDYVYAVSRNYTSKDVNNATLMFCDSEGDIAFGRSFVTEGVSLELNPDTIRCTIETIKKEILSYESRWAPSILKVLASLITSTRLSDGAPVSPFLVNDLFGILLTSISSSLEVKKIVELPVIMGNLLEDEQRFREAATIFYKAKYLMGLEEEDEYVQEFQKQNIKDVNRNVESIIGFASNLKGKIPDLLNNLEDWIAETLLNTFSVSALSALQRLCGSKDEDIGSTVDLKGIKDGIYRIFLYDSTPHGNGSSDVMRRYLHVLNIQRHKQTDQSRLLPSDDFLTLLEQELLQCPQFHTDMDALEKFSQQQKGETPSGLPELGYVSKYSDEVLRVGKDVWTKLGIRGREDAWKLPVISLAPGGFASSCNLEVDDVLRATSICWNGCPECVVHSGISGVSNQAFLDKAVLDEWFKIGRGLVDEYTSSSVEDLASGKSPIKIGRQSRVCLELPDRKIRSISLPFTIGFELDRAKINPHADLIIRDDDVHNLRMFEDVPQRSSHGIESLGFKRIMWYNLVTCAYLDILGLIDDSRKEITLVFYDCRDVTFDDIGISPRMMEAVEYHRKEAGMEGEMTHLSDILIWLAKRGFKVLMCVDERRSLEEGVRDFLIKMSSSGLDNITIMTKGLGYLMHKKALVTPLGIIQGSANLTYSGTGKNEEIINYVSYGGNGYKQLHLNISDTFHGSHKW